MEKEVASKNAEFEERRRYFRVDLPFPLLASMTLIKIQEKNVDLGQTEVLVENLGFGGLRFLSDIKLVIHPEIILEIQTEILGQTVQMYGNVVWMKRVKSGIYQYGLEFSMDESERPIQLFNQLAILLRKSSLVSDCSFVTTDRYCFFTSKKQ
nr:PilZ domain-containing protein [uncultured Bacillus sp.]